MIYTRYGSQVEIAKAFKPNADIGVFLVQAQVTVQSQHTTLPTNEQQGQLVKATDAFSRGWIPSSELVADGGPQEVVEACLEAQNGKPDNLAALLRLHWPAIFGYLELGDILQQKGSGFMSTIRRSTGM